MNKPISNSKLRRVLLAALVVCLYFALLPAFGLSRGLAQTTGEDSWTPPLNLSNSGAASAPLLLVDADNIIHVVWYDEFTGHRYTRSTGEGDWSAPVNISLPFSENTPRLLVGPGNLIYAFWIDARGLLNSSRVASENFGSSNSWEPRRQLASNVLAYDVYVDPDQNIHLAYITSVDADGQPAGVFYQQMLPTGGWSAETLLYRSLYFRSMTADQARLSLAASGGLIESAEGEAQENTVYLAWDVPAMSQVLLARSLDGGESWDEPQIIDQPGPETGTVQPFDLDVTLWNDQTMLVWKRQVSDASCSMMYQVFSNGGSWTAPASMFADTTGCPSSSGFLAQREDALVWQAAINNLLYIAAWDGSRWSALQSQSALSGFQHPVTGRVLTMGCLNMVYQAETNMLHAVGCDQNGNQDIWVTRKSLERLPAWFPPPSAWTGPLPVTSAPFGVDALHLFGDEGNSFHALWTQPVNRSESGTLHYSRWSGETWTDASPVLRSPGGSFEDFFASMGPADNLLATWRGGAGCQVYFSSAPAARAFSGVEWMRPVELLTPQGTCLTPTLAAAGEERIFVAYAIAINEGRGIYLNRSLDGGRSWEAPVQVFDAQTAQWEMVSHPAMVFSNGRLHLLWRQGTLLTPGSASGLGYAYSNDGGQTWSTADTSITAPMRWAGLAATPDGQLFRVWLQAAADFPVIVAQTSSDGGESWSPPVATTGFGEILEDPDLMADADGQIHFIQVSRDYTESAVLHHWIWNVQGWMAGGRLDLPNQSGGSLLALASGISPESRLAVLYAIHDQDGEGQLLQAALSAGSVNGQPAAGVPASEAPEAQTPVPLATLAPTSAPVPVAGEATLSPDEQATLVVTEVVPTPIGTEPTSTSTIELAPTGVLQAPDQSTDARTLGLILGVGLAAAIVIGVFGLRLLQARR